MLLAVTEKCLRESQRRTEREDFVKVATFWDGEDESRQGSWWWEPAEERPRESPDGEIDDIVGENSEEWEVKVLQQWLLQKFRS